MLSSSLHICKRIKESNERWTAVFFLLLQRGARLTYGLSDDACSVLPSPFFLSLLRLSIYPPTYPLCVSCYRFSMLCFISLSLSLSLLLRWPLSHFRCHVYRRCVSSNAISFGFSESSFSSFLFMIIYSCFGFLFVLLPDTFLVHSPYYYMCFPVYHPVSSAPLWSLSTRVERRAKKQSWRKGMPAMGTEENNDGFL